MKPGVGRAHLDPGDGRDGSYFQDRGLLVGPLNAVALLLLVLFVITDAAGFLPRLETLQLRNLVVHWVFDLGALAIVAFNVWCMFLRGRLRQSIEAKLLLSLGGQVFMMTAIAFFALDPFTVYAEAGAESGASWPLLGSAGILLLPVVFLALLARWSVRLATPQPLPAADPEDSNEYVDFKDLVSEQPQGRYEPARAVTSREALLAQSHLVEAIATARNGVAAIVRVHLVPPPPAKKSKARAPRFEASVVGSAFCVVADRHFATSHYILNDGQARLEGDKFYAVIAPQNGVDCYHFPVVAFPLEDETLDLAVLEVGPCSDPRQHVNALPICAQMPPDGTSTMTIGFPSAPVFDVNLDAEGNYVGGNLFLKSRANTGIVAAQYADHAGSEFFELNTSWHNGERGGPILRLDRPIGVFAVMQDCRMIQSSLKGGATPGPHQGHSLRQIEELLKWLGATHV